MQTSMKKRHITLSVLIHAAILFTFFFLSGMFVKGNDNFDYNVLTVSISGDPSKEIGAGATTKFNKANDETYVPSSGMGGQTPTSSTSNVAGDNGGTALNAKDSYSGSVLKKIYENKYYPIAAKKQGITGSVKISFTVNSDGKIIGIVDKVHSSGYEILDAAAIDAIKNSQPFEKFPDQIKESELTFTVVVDFVL